MWAGARLLFSLAFAIHAEALVAPPAALVQDPARCGTARSSRQSAEFQGNKQYHRPWATRAVAQVHEHAIFPDPAFAPHRCVLRRQNACVRQCSGGPELACENEYMTTPLAARSGPERAVRSTV